MSEREGGTGGKKEKEKRERRGGKEILQSDVLGKLIVDLKYE